MRALRRLTFALFVVAACRASEPQPSAPSPAPAIAAAQVAPQSAEPKVDEANRDRHGPPDVARYIAGLESDARKADLQVDLVVANLVHTNSAVIADVGCGPGVFSLPFARAVPKGLVYAVDVEPRQLDRLREHLIADRVDNVVPVLASYSTPHLPLASCDLIFIGDTFHHFDDRVAYAKNLRRFLKTDGVLAVLEYKPGKLPVGPPPDHKLAPGELERDLESAGYERAQRFDTHPYHDFEIWRVRR